MEKLKAVFSPGSSKDDEVMYDTAGKGDTSGATGKVTGEGSHFPGSTTESSTGTGLGSSLTGERDATTSSGEGPAGTTTTYSSTRLPSGNQSSSVVDPNTSDSGTFQKPGTSSTGGTAAGGVASGGALAAASQAFGKRESDMPGSFPGEGADNPYATSSIDPRVDSTTRTAPTTSGVGSGVGSGIGSGVGSGVDTQRETTSSFPTSQTEFAAPSGPPPSQSATQSRLDEPSGFAAGQSTGGSRFNESQGLASSQNLGQYRLDESQGYTSGQSLGQSRLGEPQGFTSGQTIGQSRLDEPQGIVGDRSTAQSGMDSQTSAIEGSTFHDRVTGGGLSDEGSRVAGTTGTVGTGSYDTGPTSSTTTTGAEDPNNRSGGRGKMGAILGAVGLGGAAAGGKEAYDKHEARDTSAVADTSSGYTGPPAHHRKESIPTTAYPSGSFEGGRAQNAPVGGTQPRFEQISESSSGAPGHDSAVSGTGLAHQSEPYSTSRAAEYATPVAAAVGGGALGSELGHQSGHQTRTPQEVEERARQDSWRAQAAGASSGGPQAYDSRGHEQARSAAGISAPLGHDSARDTQTSNIGSEPHRSEHGTGAVAGTTAAVAGVGAGAYALGEHEKHGATTGTTTGGYTAGDNLTSATDSTTHRDSTGMTGLAAADAADKEKYDHHHNKLQKSKKGKPGLFRRIFKSRKNKDTGADEDYSSEEEHLEDDKKSHGSGIAGGTALGAAGLGTAGASSSGTRDADETVGSRSGIRHDEMSTSMPTTGGTVADLPEDTTGTHGLSSTSAIGPDSSNYGATESYGALETEGGLSGQRAAAPAHDTTTAGTTGTATSLGTGAGLGTPGQEGSMGTTSTGVGHEDVSSSSENKSSDPLANFTKPTYNPFKSVEKPQASAPQGMDSAGHY